MSKPRLTLKTHWFALALAALPFAHAIAQTASQTASQTAIPPGTEVIVKTIAPMSSTTAITGQKFEVEVAADVIVDGRVAIPAGARGSGTVIFARKKGMGGRPGALDLRVDSVETANGSVRLKSNETNRGEDRRRGGTAATIAFGVLGALAVQGDDIAVAAGTQMHTVVATPRPAAVAASVAPAAAATASAPAAPAEATAVVDPAPAPVANAVTAPTDAPSDAPAAAAPAPAISSETTQKDPH